MGREIRRVPKDWVHPSEPIAEYKMADHMRYHKPGEFGFGLNFHPMFDQDIEEKAKEWFDGWELWKNGQHGSQIKHPELPRTYKEYCEWEGQPPDPEYYRDRAWTEAEATCYQVYETVSEGTPISPVFETKAEMTEWLIGRGHSRHAAEAFVKDEWAPSFVGIPGVGLIGGIDANDIPGIRKE